MRRRSAAMLWVVFAILLLSGLYWGLQASLGGHGAGGATARTYRLAISVPSSPDALPLFRARQGDTITLAVRSDRAGEVDVHRYEATIALTPDGEVTLTFIATAAGRFPVHLHEPLPPPAPAGVLHHRPLATLEVQPH